MPLPYIGRSLPAKESLRSDREDTLRTRVLATAAALALTASPALAQFGMGGGGDSGPQTRYTAEEKQREADSERAYRDALKATRSTTGEAYDPWRNIRSSEPQKSEPKRR